MKRISLVVLALFLGLATQAQVVKPDTSVLLKLPPDAARIARFKEKLVELALKHPDMQQYADKKLINKYELNSTGAQWLNHFSAAGNLNEFTIKGNSSGTQNNTFYPRYNFGVLLPIGNLIKIPNDVKRVRTERKVLEKQEASDALSIKATVLQLYEEYAANKQLFELHMPLVEDALLNYTQAEEKFRAGDETVSIELYKEAYRAYNGEMAKKIQLEKELRQSKLKLEEMVGTTLEQVLLQI
ncbi:hypothetical protein GFS24_04455 [Chitinophaga sp. SYP-B3965]|uniref:TolC family protein n=1 Tax=Chitinophaga sp. SYP-B3965 TaxID=2663120 RepID=UPI0012995389|nr:TolC family protein [Chitinophaga sp. SYP-B3965]MRG44350.1 hypothetical protein [Chitinophaga sp. SYP-B3965]